MNILYTNFHHGHGGGHTRYILSLLENEKHNKFVACPASSLLYKTLQQQGFTNLIDMEFPGKLKQIKKIAQNVFKLRKVILEKDIDIVHTNGAGDNWLLVYTAFLTRKRFKVVFTKHNTFKFKNFSSRWRMNRFNDAVIFVEDLAEYLDLNKNNPRFHIIYNGIDLDYWKRKEPVRTGHKLTLISTAGGARHKGWHHLVEAVAGLDEEEKKRLTVVLLSRDEAEMAREMAEAPKLCDFKNPGFFEDARPELEKADIGFVLSHREACSFAAREMMAMSLPLITSDFLTLKNMTDPGCGWVTKMKDPESIRKVLRAILAMSPEELDAMKVGARQKAETDFYTTRKMIEETDKVYARLMAG